MDHSKLFVFREARASLTLADLVANTRSVLPTGLDKADPYNYTYSGLNWAPNAKFKMVQSNVAVKSKESDKTYKTVIDFIGVPAGEKPSWSKTPVRVTCSCSAYYFYFSKWNTDSGAHARGRMKLYVPVKNPKRKVGPLNPRHLPGVCKHIAAYAQLLKDSDYITD